MQEHANIMTGPIISVYFSYGTILMRNLDVYHILYTQPIREYGLTRQFAHSWTPFLIGRAFSGSSTFARYPLELVTVTTTLCKT